MEKGKERLKREKIRGKWKRKGGKKMSEIREFLTSMETKNVLPVRFSRSAVIPL